VHAILPFAIMEPLLFLVLMSPLILFNGASTRPNRVITGDSFMLSASVTITLTAVAFVQWYSAGFM
jgi:hypothetical protein